MTFFSFKTKLYPLVAILSSLFLIVFGLSMARDLSLSFYLLGALLWICLFGCLKNVLKTLPAFLVFGGALGTIAYFSGGNDVSALFSMINRFGSLFLGVSLSMSVSSVRMTRTLFQLHIPKTLTLGMLISMSFAPLLKEEIRRVRKAMRTGGAGSILNPKIWYRAFLVPFVMRLVNISDTLSLSIETRGFTLKSSLSSLYKKECPVLSDILFLLGLTVGAILVVVL